MKIMFERSSQKPTFYSMLRDDISTKYMDCMREMTFGVYQIVYDEGLRAGYPAFCDASRYFLVHFVKKIIIRVIRQCA